MIVKNLLNGKFERTTRPFSLENFNDGHLSSKGRFFVYVPNHPRANDEGYVLRAIVAYEAYHNVSVPKEMSIHHIDGNRLNDSKENLTMMPFGQHISMHNEPRRIASLIPKECRCCGKIFNINRYRLKNPNRGQFCSQNCYHKFGRTQEHKQHISEGLKRAYEMGVR